MPVFEDDPDAPPSEEEKRAAAALHRALASRDEGSLPSPELKWLSAHLRLPTAQDALGDVRSRRIARLSREAAQAKRAALAQRGTLWTRIANSLTSSAGLLVAAGLLLFLSWLIVGQGQQHRGSHPSYAQALVDSQHRLQHARAAQMLLFRESFKRNESPTKRIDLMITTRLAERRSLRPGEPIHSHVNSKPDAGLALHPAMAVLP